MDFACHDIRWLLPEDIAKINRQVVRETTPYEPIGILDQGALESAQQAPANIRYYRQTEDMYLLSAVLWSRLIRNHPFSSGNKRTAYTAARVLLCINGYLLSAPSTDEVVQLCLEIVYRDLEEEQIAYWISKNAEPYDAQQEAIQADSWLDHLTSQLDESSRD